MACDYFSVHLFQLLAFSDSKISDQGKKGFSATICLCTFSGRIYWYRLLLQFGNSRYFYSHCHTLPVLFDLFEQGALFAFVCFVNHVVFGIIDPPFAHSNNLGYSVLHFSLPFYF